MNLRDRLPAFVTLHPDAGEKPQTTPDHYSRAAARLALILTDLAADTGISTFTWKDLTEEHTRICPTYDSRRRRRQLLNGKRALAQHGWIETKIQPGPVAIRDADVLARTADGLAWLEHPDPLVVLDQVVGCPWSPEKRVFRSYQEAKFSISTYDGRFRLRPYQCPRCGWWHLTSNKEET